MFIMIRFMKVTLKKNYSLKANRLASQIKLAHSNNNPFQPARLKIKPNLSNFSFKQQTCEIRTTQILHIPPGLLFIFRPLVRIGTFLIGRRIKKWWLKKTEAEKKEYRKWLRENNHVFLGSIGILGFTLLIYYLCNIEEDPITHRSRFIAFNDAQKKSIEEIAFEMHLKQNKGLLVAPGHPAYDKLARVVGRLLKANKDLIGDSQWTLTVVNLPIQNAYVLPGRNIFVFLGALEMVENEDQLSILIAHEMAHVILQHAMEELSNEFLIDILMILPMLFLWAMFPDLIAGLIFLVSQSLIDIIANLPHSRALENEADEIGLKLAAKACVDVREAEILWGNMRIVSELEKSGEELIPAWLSTHPPSGDREKQMNKLIPEAINLREQSKCPTLNSNDPRKKFYDRTPQEHLLHFKKVGIMK